MQRVEIIGTQDGKPFPKPWQRIVRQPLVVRLRFNLAESTPGKHAKIIGLAGFGGIWTHGLRLEQRNSDRITALWKPDHVILRTYPYVRGSGPTTDGASLSANIMRVDEDPNRPGWTYQIKVSIEPGCVIVTSFKPGSGSASRSHDSPRRWKWQWLLWSHARNGGEYMNQDEKLVYEYEIL